jgi:CTD kinase subunit beta
LERHILETIGFDFRGQYPQQLLVKVVRKLFSGEEAKTFMRVAYDMCSDLFKTFAPIKQSTFTMVLAVVELTANLTGVGQDVVQGLETSQWHTNRGCILETMSDLLDLYAHSPKSTILGGQFDANKFLEVKIETNKLIEKPHHRRFETWCERCEQESPNVTQPITPGSATSPATNTSLPTGTAIKRTVRNAEESTRFVFDVDEARKERDLVSQYFNDEMEEYKEEVEETIPSEPRNPGRNNHNHPHRNNNNHDHSWTPYRSRHGHGHGHHDRHKGRKGHHY